MPLSSLNWIWQNSHFAHKASFSLTSATGLVKFLAEVGLRVLHAILPFESKDNGQVRSTDGALLFLAYPLNIIQGSLALKVVEDVTSVLAGDFGIKRYAGDSYWMANYKNLFPKKIELPTFLMT